MFKIRKCLKSVYFQFNFTLDNKASATLDCVDANRGTWTWTLLVVDNI